MTSAASGFHDLTPGFERDFVNRAPTFFSDELYLRRGGKLVQHREAGRRRGAPVHREWLLHPPAHRLDGRRQRRGRRVRCSPPTLRRLPGRQA